MSNTETQQEVHSELSPLQVRLIKETAFNSPTIILDDIDSFDEHLCDLIETYEETRTSLQDTAFEIAEYCNITEVA